MILTLGALVVLHRRWLSRARALARAAVRPRGRRRRLGARRGLRRVGARRRGGPAGRRDRRRARRPPEGRAASLLGAAPARSSLLIAAWPTWIDLSALAARRAEHRLDRQRRQPARAAQMDAGVRRVAARQLQAAARRRVASVTDALIALTLAACLLGAVHLLRARRHALAGWIALMLLAWLVLSRTATTWVDAKSLMLTSPVVVLLAWAGVAALAARGRAAPRRDGFDARAPLAPRCSRWRSSAACSPPTSRSTTAPTSRRPPAMTSWRLAQRPLRRPRADAVHGLRRILDV